MSPPADQTPTEDFRVEYQLFDEIVWPGLRRIASIIEGDQAGLCLERALRPITLDQNAIVAASRDNKLSLCQWLLRPGIQQAPAVGRGIAELIVHGAYQTIDITPLGFERVIAGRPLQELNVI